MAVFRTFLYVFSFPPVLAIILKQMSGQFISDTLHGRNHGLL